MPEPKTKRRINPLVGVVCIAMIAVVMLSLYTAYIKGQTVRLEDNYNELVYMHLKLVEQYNLK